MRLFSLPPALFLFLLIAPARGQYDGPWETDVPACREALAEAFRREAAGDAAAWLEAAAKAVAADPSCGLAAVSLANARVAGGEIEEGLDELCKRVLAALRLPPHRVVRSDAWAGIHAARVQRKLGQPLEARMWAADVLRLDPDNRFDLWPEAFLEFRQCLMEEGRKGKHLPSSINSLLRTVLQIHVPLEHIPPNIQSSEGSDTVLSPRLLPVSGGDNRNEPRAPSVTEMEGWSEGSETTRWSCIIPGPGGDTVWCFHHDEPKASIVRGGAQPGVTVIPVAAPHPIAAAAASGGRLWVAPAHRPELLALNPDGSLASRHRLRRPTSSFGVCGRTGLVFYAADGVLWSLDPATGENREHDLPADAVAVDDLRMQVIAVAAGRDLGQLKERPFHKGIYLWTIAVFPTERRPTGLIQQAAYNEWGVTTLWRVKFEEDLARVLNVSLGGFSGDPLISTTRPLRDWQWAGSNLPKKAGSGQLHGAWKSLEIELLATLSAGTLVFEQRFARGAAHTETGGFGRAGAWSSDGGLFVCAGFDGHSYRDALDQGCGLHAYQVKPCWLDEQFRKIVKKAREPIGRDLAASVERRTAEWAARASIPAGSAEAAAPPSGATPGDAARALRAAMRQFGVPARPPWPDVERYRGLDDGRIVALERARARLEKGETGPAFAAAGLVLRTDPSFAPALALRGAAAVAAGDTAAALGDLRAALAADAGATSLSPFALHHLARLHLREQADAPACAALAAAFALGPPGPALVEEANRLLSRLGETMPMPSSRVPPIPLADPLPAGTAPDREALHIQAARGLVRVRRTSDRRETGPGLLVSTQGHILTYFRTIDPEQSEVEVDFLALENGALKIRATTGARWVRSDPDWNLALLQVEKPPAGAQPVVLADRPPQAGEDVFLFSVPSGAAVGTLPSSRGVVLESDGRIAGMSVLRHSAEDADVECGALLLSAAGECLGMGIAFNGMDESGVSIHERYTVLEADGRAAQARWLRRWLVEPRHLPRLLGRDFP